MVAFRVSCSKVLCSYICLFSCMFIAYLFVWLLSEAGQRHLQVRLALLSCKCKWWFMKWWLSNFSQTYTSNYVCETLAQKWLASTPVTQTYSKQIRPQKFKTPYLLNALLEKPGFEASRVAIRESVVRIGAHGNCQSPVAGIIVIIIIIIIIIVIIIVW